ncbi:MAG: Bro-N domain-containing protein [Candidatus Aenigmarchaeota archaeon]|nr:Bro-N domain-containing protein [Candidatus Aenigmarchaeota archaeon]
MNKTDPKNALIVFEDKNIRRIWHNNEWYFSVSDIIFVLTNSMNSKAYWRKLKQREPQIVTICHGLKLQSKDGKYYISDCVTTKNAFRLIQSIPSKKAEPFKLWLAKVGYERVQEIENPELAQKRMKELYEQKGYSKEWIEKRVRGIAIRDELTDEWTKRGIEKQKDFAILTTEITNAAFGMTPTEYKKFKGLKHQNLRDHMTDLELIFNMLGEASTTKIAITTDAQGFDKNKIAAIKGGTIAGNARKELETETKEKISTCDNYLNTPEKIKRLEKTKKD